MRIEPFLKIAKEVEAIPTYIELEKYVEQLHGTEEFDFLVMYAKSLYLFTAGHVPTVRDASLYDPNLATFNRDHVPVLVSVLSNYTDEIAYGAPTKFDYRVAGMVIGALSKRDDLLVKPAKELYRGLNKLPANVYMALCKPGESYSIGNIASTSLLYEIAENFADEWPRWNIIYVLNNKAKKGLYTGRFTSGFSDEDEIIISGDIKVTGFEWQPDWKVLRSDYYGPKPSSITKYEDLIKYVNVFEKHIRSDESLTGFTEVYGDIL